MNLDAEIERLTLAVLKAKLRTAEHEEATAACQRRVAEMCEQRAIEQLAASAKRGRKS